MNVRKKQRKTNKLTKGRTKESTRVWKQYKIDLSQADKRHGVRKTDVKKNKQRNK